MKRVPFWFLCVLINAFYGSFGNIKGKGNHDDVLMSTAIGLYISQYEMDAPKIVAKKVQNKSYKEVTEATI